MPTGQTFQMAKWLLPRLQLSSAAAASESGLRTSGVLARSRQVHSGGTSGPGTTGGMLPPVLSALGRSDSWPESKAGRDSSSPEPGCMGLDPTVGADGKMVNKLPGWEG